MRTALILDTETTGLDRKADSCIEVAACLYDLTEAAPIESYASLIRHNRNPAYEINRITIRALEVAPLPVDVWGRVEALVKQADVVLAHRAEFDRAFVPADLRELRPWVCTKFHVEWPHGKPGDSLIPLALAHGVGVSSAHRAAADVDTLARLLTRVHEMLDGDVGYDKDGKAHPPLVHLLTQAMRPRTKVQAVVSYDDREKAKAAGFAWEPASKRWLAELPDDKIAALPFPTRAA